MKKFLLLGFVLFSASLVYAASWSFWRIPGTGSRWNTTEFEILSSTEGSKADFIPGTDNTNDLGHISYQFKTTYTYDLNVADDLTVVDDIVRGSATSEASTATVSGGSIGDLQTVYLSGDTAAVEGSLIIATTTVGGEGVSGAVSLASTDQTNWIGFAAAAASTGSVVQVYMAGSFAFGLTTGTVAPGDVVVSSVAQAGTRGYLGVDNTPTTGADVGVVVGPRGTSDRTLIRLR